MECGGKAFEESLRLPPENIEHRYFKCSSCGESWLGMDQLHEVAEKFRKLKLHQATLSRWGKSIGLRIPKELAEKYKFGAGNKVFLLEEKDSIQVVRV